MDRGALYAEEHDLILRRLPKTTGKGLQAWFKELDRARVGAGGFLKGLEHLRDRKHVPHQEASAIVWAYLNPSVLPDEMKPRPARISVVEERQATYETGLAAPKGTPARGKSATKRKKRAAAPAPRRAAPARKATKPSRRALAAKGTARKRKTGARAGASAKSTRRTTTGRGARRVSSASKKSRRRS